MTTQKPLSVHSIQNRGKIPHLAREKKTKKQKILKKKKRKKEENVHSTIQKSSLEIY